MLHNFFQRFLSLDKRIFLRFNVAHPRLAAVVESVGEVGFLVVNDALLPDDVSALVLVNMLPREVPVVAEAASKQPLA